MPLLTTPGAPDSNSYATVDEADAYNASRPFGTAWANLTTAQKEGALIYATMLLDGSFIWTGQASVPTAQMLCWPRDGMYTRNQQLIGSLHIPYEIKAAQSEYARQASVGDITADNEAAKQGLESVKAGSVSVSFHGKTQAENVILSAPAYAYLNVPGAVRILIVPSWYIAQPILDTITGSLGNRGYMFEVDR